MKIEQPKIVSKSWGYEKWIHNDEEYCGKLLVFPNEGNYFSMHYHLKKKETWYVQSGSFELRYIDTENGECNSLILNSGVTITVERGQPHQLIALEDNSIMFEVSTEHFDDDSYRITREKYESYEDISNRG